MMYVDESGDQGFGSKSSARFVRVGAIVHDSDRQVIDESVTEFKTKCGLRWDAEIRAADIRRGSNAFNRMKPKERSAILNQFLELIAGNAARIRILGVCIHKQLVDTSLKKRLSNPGVRSVEMLLERYNAFLDRKKDNRGLVILDECEATNDANIRYFQNYLRQHSDRIKAKRIVEGTMFLPSGSSNLLQVADVCANVLFRRYRFQDQATSEWSKLERSFEIVEWPD